MRLLRVAALMAGTVYLGWRAAFTWEGTNIGLFVALLLAELYGLLRTQIDLELLRRPDRPRREVRGEQPTDVDVVVLALDEPASEIRAALLAARAIEGGRKVTLVDRDGRPELSELAERFEIPRVVGSAKADVGSLLNRALSGGDSEFAILLPGDVVVMPDVATITAPCFDDPEIAVVVGTVEATNAARDVDYDGYGRQRIRDELMTPGLDAAHALPWWNGVSMIRRAAIDEVGGFATGRRDVTLPTGVRLQVGGWRVAENGVVVARRLVSWTDERQVHRWSRDLHARLDLLKRDDISWSSTRITPRMRLAYWSALLDATRGIQRLVLVAVLIASLAGAGLPIVAPLPVLVGAWATQMGLRLVARRAALRPLSFQPWIVADLRLLTTDLVVAWRVWRRTWVEQDMHDSAPGRRLRGVFLWGLHIALTLAIAGPIAGVVTTTYSDSAQTILLGSAVWLWGAALQAKASMRLRQGRMSFRAAEALDVMSTTDAGLVVVGVSPFGIDVMSRHPMEVGDRYRLAFGLPAADGSASRFETSTVVRRVDKESGNYAAYLRFSLISDEEMDRVIEYCAVVAGHRALRDGRSESSLLAELIEASPPDEATSARTSSLAGSGRSGLAAAIEAAE